MGTSSQWPQHHPDHQGRAQRLHGRFTNSVAIGANRNAVGTVKLKDMRVEISGHDVDIVY